MPNSNSDWSSHQPMVESGSSCAIVGHHAEEVRQLGGQLLHQLLRGGVAGGILRLEQLLAESEGPASERVEGVVGEVVREPAPHQDPEHALEVVDDHRAHRGALLDHRGRPLVAQEHGARGEDPLTEGRLPVVLRRRALERRRRHPGSRRSRPRRRRRAGPTCCRRGSRATSPRRRSCWARLRIVSASTPSPVGELDRAEQDALTTERRALPVPIRLAVDMIASPLRATVQRKS